MRFSDSGSNLQAESNTGDKNRATHMLYTLYANNYEKRNCENFGKKFTKHE